MPADAVSALSPLAVVAFGSAPYFSSSCHQRRVARLRGANERRGAILEEPLHREDRAGERVFLHRAFGLAPLSSSSLMISR